MKQLVPPMFQAPSLDLPDVTIPFGGIHRPELLAMWRDEMVPPKPDSKCLENDMNAWAEAIGKAEWFGDRYAPVIKSFLTNRRVALADPAAVDEAARVCADAVEPLSRYSAGWVRSLDVLRPRGLPNQVASAIREAQRWSATRVRDDMSCGAEAVQETQRRLDGFIAHPETRHAHDQQLALDAFATKLDATVLRWHEKRGTDPKRDAVLVAQRQAAITEYGAVPAKAPSAADQERLRRQAADFLDPVMEELVASGKYSPEYLSEAYLRVLKTYTNRLAKGQPLKGTEHFLVLRLRAVKVDEFRRSSGRGRTVSFSSNQDGEGHSDDRVEDRIDELDQDDELGRLVADAVELIRADPAQWVDGELYWEAQTAVDLLTGAALELGVADAVIGHVERAWCETRPAHSRSVSAAQAATEVMLMMRTSTNRALRARGEASGETSGEDGLR